MNLNVGGYTFEGPFDNVDSLEDKSGLYVITSFEKGENLKKVKII